MKRFVGADLVLVLIDQVKGVRLDLATALGVDGALRDAHLTPGAPKLCREIPLIDPAVLILHRLELRCDRAGGRHPAVLLETLEARAPLFALSAHHLTRVQRVLDGCS